jgi:cysteine desulfurase family protein
MIYCNNATTTWPKPECVYQAADRCLRTQSSPLRGSAREDCTSTPLLDRARKDVAAFFELPDPNRLVFTPGCTYALNLAILGLPWEAGDLAIMSGLEHHAVSRPIRKLARERGVRFEVAPYKPGRPIDLDWVGERLKAGGVRLVACTMASNVTGDVFPVEKVAALARRHGALCLVDGAQAGGVLAVRLADLGADLVGFAGHKGLFGPPGVGILYVAPGVQLNTLAEGGTGKDSGKHEMNLKEPVAFEVGTHNLPGIVGTAAGVKWVAETGAGKIRDHERELARRFLRGLEKIDGVKVYGTKDVEERTGVVSITMRGTTPKILGRWLADAHDVVTRAGFHCAPLAHETIGTLPGDGTLRFSFGYFNSTMDVDLVLDALRDAARRPSRLTA